MDFALTGVEIIFLLVAVLVTVPILVFWRWVIKELRKEESARHEPGPDKTSPGTP